MMQRSIFIAGAAAGIGAASACRFHAHGWFVGLFDVDVAGVERLAAEFGGGRALAGKLDVSNPGDRDAAPWCWKRPWPALRATRTSRPVPPAANARRRG